MGKKLPPNINNGNVVALMVMLATFEVGISKASATNSIQMTSPENTSQSIINGSCASGKSKYQLPNTHNTVLSKPRMTSVDNT